MILLGSFVKKPRILESWDSGSLKKMLTSKWMHLNIWHFFTVLEKSVFLVSQERYVCSTVLKTNTNRNTVHSQI